MSDRASPSSEVLSAFGASGEPVRLSGGAGEAWRVGDLVLKPAVDCPETNWIAEFYSSAPAIGFQLPEPVRCVHGWIVHDGWQAWKHIPGEHRKDQWKSKLQLCRDFHGAISGVPRPGYFDQRERTPWVVADHFVWGETELKHHSRIKTHAEVLEALLRPVSEPAQLIHGDFAGNVIFEPGRLPAVIDFSPYWRPATFAAGVVVADAIVWEGADMSLLDGFGMFQNFSQYVIRGELRRIVELEMLERLYGWDVLGQIDAHVPLIEELCRREAESDHR